MLTWAAMSFLCCLLTTVRGVTHTIQLPIINKVVAPDTVQRSATLAGGTLDGPLISGNKGDRFKINVINQLHDSTQFESTSVHWHGLHQNRTNYADGTSWVTQCPITANNSFLYDFSVPNQAGTFWYHSHYETQYCDGLRGPLIIYDPQDPNKDLYDVDDESTILSLSDWYHFPAKGALVPLKLPPYPDSMLFNGKGRTNETAEGLLAPLSVTNVEQGRRYRIRLIHMGCSPGYNFSIDSHTMTIIEVEGTPVHPHTVDSIHILAGQRYSFVLTANQTVSNYWMRALTPYNFAPGMNSAILRYKGAPVSDPTSEQTPSTLPMLEPDLVPIEAIPAPGAHHPGGADVNINLAVGVNFSAPNQMYLSLNDVPFVSPSVPVLLQILSGALDSSLAPAGAVYTLPPNKVIEVTLPASTVDSGGPHPMHLHGHDVFVVRSGDSDVYNWDNPLRRDTVSGGLVGSNMTFRFVTDNSGPWFLHCHIDWHLERGMAVVFAESPSTTAQHSPVPDSWKRLCPTYNNVAQTNNKVE